MFDFILWFAIAVSVPAFLVLMAIRLTENNVFFTVVQQGTEKHVMRWGKYVRTCHAGLNWVGIWPIWKIYTYNFGWTEVGKNGSFVECPKRRIDYILVKETVYGLIVEDAEDKKLVPLTWLITMTVVVKDSRKALQEVQNWLDAIFSRIAPYARNFSSCYSYEEFIQGEKGKAKAKMVLERALWERLEKEGVFADFLTSYGILVRKLEIADVNPDENFRKLTVQKRKGEANRAQAIAETSDRIVMGVAKRSGMKLKDFLADIKAHPEKKGLPVAQGGYMEYYREENDIVKRDRAGAAGELRDVRVGNSDGTAFGQGSLSEIVGGVVASVASSWANASKDTGGASRKKPSRAKRKDDEDVDDEDESSKK